MARWLLAGGAAALLMGAGLAIPVGVAHLELRQPSRFAPTILAMAALLCTGGIVALGVGLLRKSGETAPSAIRMAITGNALLLGFCAMELSDRFVRQHGRIVYWTTFLLPVALATYYGLVSGRRWGWWVCRGLTASAAIWFLAFLPIIPFAEIRGEGGAAPWYARVYVCGMTAMFAGASAGAFWALGRTAARKYFDTASNPILHSAAPTLPSAAGRARGEHSC